MAKEGLNSKLVRKALKKSPWVSHLNAGSCNGCDIEIVASLSPRYDLERFGIKLQGSIRHADVLICTGAVTRMMAPRIREIYDQMANPKFVIVVGACGISGGVYQNCYNVLGGVDNVLPVDLYIPGCPPRPEAIAFGVYKLLQTLTDQPEVQQGSSEEQPSEISIETEMEK